MDPPPNTPPLLLLQVYAFGILMWEAYTGLNPFEGVPRALLGHQVGTRRHASVSVLMFLLLAYLYSAVLTPDFFFG